MVPAPGGAVLPGRVNTGQPSGTYIRRPQDAKFFTYLHAFTPNVGQWVAGAVGARDSFQVDGDAEFHVLKQAILAFDANGQRLGDTVAFEVSPVSEGFNFLEMFLSGYGSGPRPGIVPTPLVLPRSAIFTAIANNRNNTATLPTILVAHFGAKVYRNPYLPQRVYRQQKPYAYSATYSAFAGTAGSGVIPASGVGIVSLRTDGDSDFDVRKITVVSDAPVTVQVQSDEDKWFLRPLRSELLGGSLIEVGGALGFVSGEYPFIMPVPRLISGAGYINTTLTNTDAVNAVRAQVVFWGTRLYPAGGVRR